VTEKWVWWPRGFEFLEEAELLVSTHGGSQNSHPAVQVQPSITEAGRTLNAKDINAPACRSHVDDS
jgi:hypothetical protein